MTQGNRAAENFEQSRNRGVSPRHIRGLAFVPACLLVVSSLGCSEPEAEATAESEPQKSNLVQLNSAATETANFQLTTVTTARLQEELRVSGRIKLNENATSRVGSFVEAVVVETRVPVGASVKKGQVLALLHSHELHDAESHYWKARAELEGRQEELEYARLAYNRASRLYELKAGSLQQVQAAEAELRRAETAVKTAKTEVDRAASHLRYLGFDPPEGAEESEDLQPKAKGAARQRLHLISLRSPISGIVVERSVTEGAVVSPSDTAFVISDLRRLWVIAQVPERHLGLLRTGIAVDIFVQAYPNRAFPARVSYIADSLDPETRTVQVRCEVPNPRRQLKTEMYAQIAIQAPAQEPSLVIPTVAVQRIEGQSMVFVAEADNRFRARRIETGAQIDAQIEVVEGLQQGEKVVGEGSFLLKAELLKSRFAEE